MTQRSAPVRLEWPGKTVPKAAVGAVLEHHRHGHPSQMLIAGDNLRAMHALARRGMQSVMLAYMDPPFFTGRSHEHVKRSRDPKTGEMMRTLKPAFDDRWDGLGAYLSELRDRIAIARELLAPEGCLIVHVDPKTSHYIKVICDEVFGPRSFASEIVWRYRRWPAKTANFQRVHDVLLRYVKDPDAKPRFRQLYEPLAPSTLATWGTKKQRAVVGKSGRRVRSSTTEESTPGAPMGDGLSDAEAGSAVGAPDPGVHGRGRLGARSLRGKRHDFGCERAPLALCHWHRCGQRGTAGRSQAAQGSRHSTS